MRDWMEDSAVVRASGEFNSALQEWLAVAAPERAPADLTELQQQAFIRMKVADRAYVRARDNAISRLQDEWATGGGRRGGWLYSG